MVSNYPAGLKFWRLLQLRVLELGGDEDGDVRVGVFPQVEKILIRSAGFGGVALQCVSTRQS